MTREETYTHARRLWSPIPVERAAVADLDPQKHKDLIFELVKYRSRGADVYFGRKATPFGEKEPAMREEELRLAFEHGVRLQVWRTRLISWLEDKSAPAGEQTVVQLRYEGKPGKAASPKNPQSNKPVANFAVGAFIVTEDLSGPDPRVSNWHGAALAGSTVLLFDGKPHFISGSGVVVQIRRDFGSGPSTFCELEFDFKKGRQKADQGRTTVLSFATTSHASASPISRRGLPACPCRARRPSATSSSCLNRSLPNAKLPLVTS